MGYIYLYDTWIIVYDSRNNTSTTCFYWNTSNIYSNPSIIVLIIKLKNMIIDKRIQERKITIDFALTEYKYSLDEIIDQILPDIEKVIEQRESYEIKTKITVE